MAHTSPSIAWRYRKLENASNWSDFHFKDGVQSSTHPAKCPTDLTATSSQPVSPGVPDTPEEKMARLRAVLFLAKEPLSSRKLSQYSNLADGTEARTLVTQLNRELDANGRAFRAEPVAGGFQLVTRPQFAKWLRRLEHVPGNIRLSAPAMETLAVVAYRQPVMRVDVEAVRGVGCGEMLSQLLDRDLVRISGRSTELGRPYLYSTTKRFLMIFGLRSLEELPRAELFQELEPEEDELEESELDDEEDEEDLEDEELIASDSEDDEDNTEATSDGISEEN